MAIDVGTARVVISGDYSKLSSDFAAAQGVAASGSSAIAGSVAAGMGAAKASTEDFSEAINRLIAALQEENAALSLSIQRNIALSGSVKSVGDAARGSVCEIQATGGAIRGGSGGSTSTCATLAGTSLILGGSRIVRLPSIIEPAQTMQPISRFP